MRIGIKLIVAAAVALGGATGLSHADEKLEGAIKARKSLMTLYAINIGQLVAMAKTEIDFDSDKAKTAAENLRILASMNNSAVWPQGSDSTAMPGKTSAKLEAWTTYPASAKHQKALIAAASAMVDAADSGLESVQSNLKAIGGACKACHEDFREPK